MDLRVRVLLVSSLILLASSSLFGAGKLRLETTAVGPLSVATGSNGPTQTINALNGGDAPLSLSATSSVSWLAPTVQTFRSCGTLGNCYPIQIALNTAALAKGTYTGVVTISDPNALDAPQTITVTVAVGGGVPDAITMYVPKNGTEVSRTFSTANAVSATANSPANGPALSLVLPTGGSFQSTYSYTLKAKSNPGVNEGTYNGSLVIAGSTVPGENKTVPVTLNVTSQPIASLSTSSLSYRIAQGAAAQTQNILLTDAAGSGYLTPAGATVATTSGGNFITTTTGTGYVSVVADPAGLQPGTYAGTVTIATGAANGSVDVPVTLNVVATAAPFVRAGSVVNNATFTSDTLAQGDFPAVFGEQFTAGGLLVASNVPYPTTLGGASVYINDQPVPLYFVSANQINFLVPFNAKTGDGTLRVDRDGQRGNSVSIRIAERSPKILVATDQAGKKVSDALAGALATVHTGDYITIYAFGFGAVIPPVPSNSVSPANPLSVVPGTNTVYFGQGGLFSKPVPQTPQFIGLSPNFISHFYQINVQIPANAPKGNNIPVYIQGDAGTTNVMLFNIQ